MTGHDWSEKVSIESLARTISKVIRSTHSSSEKCNRRYFKFHDGKELLSLVSKKWYKFIARSSQDTNKIRIHITEYFWSQHRTFTSVDVVRMIANGRQYKHFSITSVSSSNRYQQLSCSHKLLIASYRWVSVSLCDHSFSNEIEFLNFLSAIEPFTETIELRSIKTLSFVGADDANFQFPKLRILRLINVCKFAYGGPFKNVNGLKEFCVATEKFLPSHINHSKNIRERVQSIEKIMLKNQNISDMELFIEQEDFDIMFVNPSFVR